MFNHLICLLFGHIKVHVFGGDLITVDAVDCTATINICKRCGKIYSSIKGKHETTKTE